MTEAPSPPPTLRGWIVAGLVLVLALTGLGVGVAWHAGDRPCGEAVVSHGADASRSPFVDPGTAADPRLVEAVAAVGEPVGGYGYDYEPPQLTAYAAGLGVRLRGDNRFTLLDDELAPRWSVAVGTRSSTFDADDTTYVVVTLPDDAAPEVVALDLDSGERRWCSTLESDPVTDEPVATRLLDDGSVVALVGGDQPRLSRTGERGTRWSVDAPAGRADFLGPAPGGTLLVGGSPLTDLLDAAALAALPSGVRLSAHDPGSGQERWAVEEPAGTDLHVVGTTAELVVAVRATTGADQPELVALGPGGAESWAVTPAPGTAFDATVRGDRVLVRAGTTWSAYDAVSGAPLWAFAVPTTPQYLPYGSTLAALPSLDADTLLVGATDALVTLDLRDGSRTTVPLPTDGVSTAFWPVSLALSPDLLGVVTNRGTVVARRDPTP